MAKRFTDTEIWEKEWFMSLKPRMKCLVKFVRDRCDLAGIWSANWRLAEMYIGEKVNESELLSIDGGRQFAKLPSGKIFCTGFINFQYGQYLNPASPVHKKILDILEKEEIDLNTLSNTLLNRVSNTLQEEEEDKEEEKDKEKEKEKEEVIQPFGENFKPIWDGWKQYRKEEHRKSYKSPKTEVAALNQLFKISRGDPEAAKQIIEQSIANGWQGLFELKNKLNANSKDQSFTRQGVAEALANRLAERRQAGG